MHSNNFIRYFLNELEVRKSYISVMQRALDLVVSLSLAKILSYWRTLEECIMDIREILEERILRKAYLCVNSKHPARFSGQDSSRQRSPATEEGVP